MVTDAKKKMKQGKSGGPSGVIHKMIRADGRESYCDIRACESNHI